MLGGGYYCGTTDTCRNTITVYKKEENTKTLNFLNDLASIAEYIAFEEIIQQQLKQDIKTSKINIIIQKKQPKRILAQYLHAAYFPVPSIFIKAKKMKTS